MREILFRGKVPGDCPDEDLRGQWVEGNLVHQTEYYGSPVDRYHILYTGEFDYDYYDSVIVIPETVGQYTGLKDKNGTKVYEGDILFQSDMHGNSYMRVVDYYMSCGSCCNQVIGFGTSGHGHTDFINIDRPFEIVGNIHDNPELLEENV